MRLTMEPNIKVVSVGRGKVKLVVTLQGVSATGAPNIPRLVATGDVTDPITLSKGDSLTLPVVWDVNL
jgi:hypothetical protein